MISTSQFEASVTKTLAGGSTFGYPRKPVDRTVLLGALSIYLMQRASYLESELNEAIDSWLHSFSAVSTLDRVTLRRYLVDAGYLRRDDAGMRYSVDAAALAADFEEPVLSLDVQEVVRAARAEREARRQAYGG